MLVRLSVLFQCTSVILLAAGIALCIPKHASSNNESGCGTGALSRGWGAWSECELTSSGVRKCHRYHFDHTCNEASSSYKCVPSSDGAPGYMVSACTSVDGGANWSCNQDTNGVDGGTYKRKDTENCSVGD